MSKDKYELNFPRIASVAKISSRIHNLLNGIRHCSIQVTLDTGEEYLIEAYDEEADQLYNTATKYSNPIH